MLAVKLRELLGWHIVDEEVVSYLTVSINTLLMSLGHTLGENAWVFSIEEEVDPGQLAILASAVPDAREDAALAVIVVN